MSVKIADILGSSFRPNIEDYNFIYQFKFRQQSIMIHFLKESICATLIIIMLQYINYNYLNLFTERRYKFTDDYSERVSIISANLHKYQLLNTAGQILSISYFLSLISRIIYNAFSCKKIPPDLWLLFDIIAGAVNLAAFNIIGRSTPE